MDDDTSDSSQKNWPIDLICHPAVLAAVVVVAVNDHLLKGSGLLPGAVTGKLSDVAGLFFFPVLVAALLALLVGLLRRHATLDEAQTSRWLVDTAVIATAAGFTAVNIVEPVNAFAEQFWGVFTMDPTDLYCLPMVVVARQFMLSRSPSDREDTAEVRQQSTGLRWPHYAALFCTAAVSIATPAPPVTVSDFPHWEVVSPVVHCQHDVEITPWVAKSGKTGVGVVLRFDDTAEQVRTVSIEEATLHVWHNEHSPANTRLRTEAAGIDPVEFDETESVYLPFEFDNNSAWNDDLNRGRVTVDMLIDDLSAEIAFNTEQRPAEWSRNFLRHRRYSADAENNKSSRDEDIKYGTSEDGFDENDEFLVRDPDRIRPDRIRLSYDPPGGCQGVDDE